MTKSNSILGTLMRPLPLAGAGRLLFALLLLGVSETFAPEARAQTQDTTGPAPTLYPIHFLGRDVFTRTFPVDIVFGHEFVVGTLDTSEITVTNGRVANLRETTPGFGWSATISATEGYDGPVTIAIAAGAVQDYAGNDSLPGMITTIVDQSRATTTITRPPGETGPVEGPFDIIIEFSESMRPGIRPPTVSNGLLLGPPLSFGNPPFQRYRATVIPTANGTVTVGMGDGFAHDLAGNANLAAQPLGVTAEYIVLRPRITTPRGLVKGAFPITVRFNAPVVGFTQADLKVENATVSNFSGSGTTYTATITPPARHNGLVTVDIDANAAMTAAGERSTAAQLEVMVDQTAPTATISPRGLPSPGYTRGGFGISIEFNEPVTGLELGDFTLSIRNGTRDTITALRPDPTDRTGTRYLATIDPTSPGPATVTLRPNSVTDAAGNPNETHVNLTVTADYTPPTVQTLSPRDPGIRNGPFLMTIAFSEVVRGFELSDLIVRGGTARDLLGNDPGFTYTVYIDPAGGEVSVTINANAVTDLAGNPNKEPAMTVDRTGPTATISPQGLPDSGIARGSFDISIEFNEPVTGLELGDFNLAVRNGLRDTISRLRPDPSDRTGTRYLATVDPKSPGPVVVQLARNSVTDEAGNPNETHADLVVTADFSHPTIEALTGSTRGTVSGPFHMTIVFSEPVHFELSDLIVRGGTASDLLGNSPRRTYTATITPTVDGELTVDINANAVTDPAGNPNREPARQFSIMADLTPPTVAIARPEGQTGLVNGPFDVTVTFSEPVNGFDMGDLTVGNGTARSIRGHGATYTARITPTPGHNGPVTVDIPANRVTDVVGRSNEAAAQFSVIAEQTIPTVEIEGPTGPVRGAFPITVRFSEAVNGFDAVDLRVGNGTAGNFQGSGAVYTAMITPAATGPVTVDIAANRATDAASNGNEAAAQFSVMADLTVPTVQVSGPTGTVTAPFYVTITFSEAVSGLDVEDLTVGNGTAGNLQGRGTTYTARITPAAPGLVTVDIPANRATDSAANGNEAADQFSVTADLVAPTVAIGRPNGERGPVRGAFNITITFSESVTRFGLTDLRVGNGTASNFRGSGATYTARITPPASYNGPVTVDIPANVAGNGNTEATRLSVLVDRIAPTVGIARSDNEGGVVNGAFDITIAFSDAVTGLTLTDLTVGNGTASNLQGSGAVYTARIAPTAGYSGPVTIDIPANAVADAAGHSNQAARRLSVTADLEAPTVTIARAGSASRSVNGAFDITITFSELVTGLALADLRVGNGTASNLQGSGTTYRATITPDEEHRGPVTIDIAADTVTDAVGNGNRAARFSVTSDLTGPRVASITSPTRRVSGPFDITITFNEPVTGLALRSLTVGNGTASNLRGSGDTYTVRITPIATGAVTVDIAANAVVDAAGNSNQAADPFSVTADLVAPTVQITGPTEAVNSPFDITIIFSEAVNDFDVRDLTVGNGTATNVRGSGTTYAVRIAPIAAGAVTVDIAANAVTDAAGNGNQAADQFSVTAELVPTTVAIAHLGDESNSVNGAFDITITFSDAVTGLGLTDLRVGNGTASNLRGRGADYTATITPRDGHNGPVTVDIPANVVRDTAGNGNRAAAQFSVTADLIAPTVEITGPTGTVSGPFNITITFSEAVNGFNADDLTVGNGTAGNLQGNGTAYTARITPTSNGPVTVDIAANKATDAGGNGNQAADQLEATAALTAPTVTIGRPEDESGPVNGDFNITITFSNAVTGFGLTDLTVDNGTASNFQGSGAAYRARITPAANYDGEVTVDIAAGAVDGGNSAATQLSVTVDRTVPRVRITGPTNPVRGTFPITVTFTEPVDGFNADDLDISNGSVRDIQGSGAVYTAMIEPIVTPSNAVTVRIAANVAVDAAGNGNEAAPQFSVTVDQTAPTVAIARAEGEGNQVNGAFDITVTFSEAVTELALTALSVRNGTASNLRDTGDSTVYRATITPRPNYNGLLAVNLGANAAIDAAGNGNAAASQFSVTVDQRRPTVGITRPAGQSGAVDDAFDIIITFREAVTGFGLTDLTVGNGTASDFDGNGTTYTATITPDAGYTGPVTVDIAANAATDTAGNGNTAATQLSVMADQTGPTVLVSSARRNFRYDGHNPFEITITFSEPVTGFDKNDVKVTTYSLDAGEHLPRTGFNVDGLRATQGTASSIVDTGDGAVYTARITPALADDREGIVAVQILADAVVDALGNANTATPNSPDHFFVYVDRRRPRVPRPTGPGGQNSARGGAFDISITFTEPVTDFDESDVRVSHGVTSSISPANPEDDYNQAYTARITPNLGYDGTLTVDILDNAAIDVAGNGNIQAGQLLMIVRTAPTVAIGRPEGQRGPVRGGFDITITFDDEMIGFELDDLTVGNGTASNLRGSGANYTASITPAQSGPVTVDIAANVATDVFNRFGATRPGNGNLAAEQFSVTADLDFTGPTVTIARSDSESNVVNGAFPITVTFTEPVTGFDENDLRVSNGTVSNFSGTGAVYTATITPTGGQGSIVSAEISADAATDASGNGNMATSNSRNRFSVRVDLTAPTVRITRVDGESDPVNGAFDTTITFSEPVNGFQLNDITVSNGTAGNFTDTGHGAVYRARITPDTDYNGPVTMDIAANVATDAAGNSNQAAPQFSVTVDRVAPTPRITGPTSPVNGVFGIAIAFGEAVTGFELDDITVSNGAAGNLQSSGATYTAMITPATTGSVTVDVGANRLRDTAGNPNEAADQFSVTANLTAPTVTIARPVGETGPVNSAFGITITFSESVTGLALTELRVGNGTASNLEGSGANYTAVITPTPDYDGPVTVDIAANVATDGTGRGNTAAVQFSATSDQTAPRVTLTGPAHPVSGTFPVTVTFTEPVNDFNADDVRISNGRLRDIQGSGAVYTVMIDPILTPSRVVIVRVSSNRAFDAAGNGNERLPVFLSVRLDQTAPTVAIAGPTEPVSSTFPITVTFSEAVTGFDLDDLTVGNGTAISVRDTGDGATYRAMITPDAGYNGAVTVDIAANVAEDVAGNASEAAQQLSVTADQTAPTVTITGPSGEGSVNGASFDITITFNEPMNGFEVRDLRVGNGRASNVRNTGNGTVYTATITPRIGYAGPVTVDIPAGVAEDAAGNGNQAAPQFSVTVTSGPTPYLLLIHDQRRIRLVPRTFNLDISYHEFVTNDLSISDITVDNGTVTNLQVTAPRYSWRITVTANEGYEGPLTVEVAEGAVRNADGNDSKSGSLMVTVDQTPPTPTIRRPAGQSGLATGPFNIIIDFGEHIPVFTGHITVNNGRASSPTTLPDDPNRRSVIVTPENDGPVTVGLGGTTRDRAGNPNRPAQPLTVQADVRGPVATIARPAGESGPVAGPFNIEITFNEVAIGFEVGDLVVGNGRASNFSGQGNSYTATITPTAGYDGPVTVEIPINAVTDALGKSNEAVQFEVMADQLPPTVAIARPVGERGPVTGPFNITITFSEPVTGFTLTDLTVGNGTASNLQGNGAAYTATITPTANYNGRVTVDIPANAVEDVVNRPNTAAPQFALTVDRAAPTVAIGRLLGESGPVNGAFDITITFSEAVTGFTLTDLTVGNGTASNLTNSRGDRTQYTATITPTREGTVTVDLGANAVMDAAGYDNQAAPQFSVTADLTVPTVTFAGPRGGSTVTGPFDVTVTFSEPVNGFDENGLTVTTLSGGSVVGTAGNIQGSGTRYTATITPGRNGTLAVRVPAGVATDAAGNGNRAGTTGQFLFSQLELTASLQRPTVIIGRSSGESGPVKGAFGITITFSSSVSGFNANDLTVGNGTASNFSGSGRSYRATITPDGGHNGPVTVDIPADVASGNHGATQFSVTADQTAPTVEYIVGPIRPVNGPFDITVTFSEPVKNFTVRDLTVSNGTADSFLGRGRTYTARITPTRDGPVTVDVRAGVAMDAAGNRNTAVTQQFSVTADLSGDTAASRLLTLSGTALTLDEDEQTSYLVSLASRPSGNVMVMPMSWNTDIAQVSGTLTFTPSNWNQPQRVTVTGINDNRVNDPDRRTTSISHSLSGSGYDKTAGEEVAVTVIDTAPEVALRQNFESSSASTAVFKLVSTPPPATDMQVMVMVKAVSVGPGGANAQSPSGETSTQAIAASALRQHWDRHDHYLVAALPNQPVGYLKRPGQTRIRVSKGQNTITIPAGQGLVELVVEQVENMRVITSIPLDENAEYRCQWDHEVIMEPSVAMSTQTLRVGENGESESYTLALSLRPSGEVTVMPRSSDERVATVSGPLTFNPDNWDQPQRVTVTGVDDAIDNDPDRSATILHEVEGGGYDGVTIAPVVVTTADNETAGATVTPTTLTVDEAGGTGTYTIVLTSQPTADVTVTPASADGTVATVSGPLTFTASNWNQAQTVMVTGVDDNALNDPDRTTGITHRIAGGGYDGVGVDDVAITVVDDEENVAVSIRAIESSVTEGEPVEFELTAVPAPTADLVVAIAVTDPGSVLVDTAPTEVTIPANQSTALVELETDDDEVDELDATVTITLEAATNADYTIAEAPDNSASVTVTDDDGLTQERREEGIEHALGAFGRATGWDLVETIRDRSRNSVVQGQAFEITNLPSFGSSGVDRPRPTSLDLFELLERDAEVRVTFNPQVAQGSASGSLNKSPLLRAWLKANRTDLRSDPFDGRTQEGGVTTGRLGVDVAYDSGWLVGSVFSWHDGDIEFDDSTFTTEGEVDIELFSINPYVSLTKGKLHLWGTIGGGLGTLSYEDSPTDDPNSTSSDLRMLTAAAGAEYAFGRLGPFDLKGRGEGVIVNLKADDSSHALVGYDDIGVTVYGARGELELGLPVNFDSKQTEFRPYVFTGLRQDGGLGNDLALEYGGGFALRTGSLVAEGSIRSQFGSEGDGVKLTGYSISLAYDRGNDRKGLVARFEQSAGPSDYDPYGVGALSSFAGEAATRFHLGYGIGWDEQLLRPFVEMDWQESQRSGLDIGLEYQYGDGSASLGYSDGELNLGFRFQKLF